METVLEARQISKRFPGVLANDCIDFELRAGEVHALLGENGASKSTLMGLFYGLHQPDSGQILIHGREVLLQLDKAPARPGKVVLEVEHLEAKNDSGRSGVCRGRRPSACPTGVPQVEASPELAGVTSPGAAPSPEPH